MLRVENCIEAIRTVEPGHPGSIEIDVEHDPAKKTFTLTIRDNGVGINPADMDRVVAFGFAKRGANAAADQEHRVPHPARTVHPIMQDISAYKTFRSHEKAPCLQLKV